MIENVYKVVVSRQRGQMGKGVVITTTMIA